MISVLILTKNEERNLPDCLSSVHWSDDVHIYDSMSTDKTLAIAKSQNCHVTQRVFDDWASHQNWGLMNIPFKYEWVFYLDADERISPELQQQLMSFTCNDPQTAAFEVRRRDFAWNGIWLKHAQISPFYLRLFRPSKMRYERLVNPVSVPMGNVKRLNGFLDHYPFSKGFTAWWRRHLNYAELEAQTRLQDVGQKKRFSLKKAFLDRDFSVRRYHQKGLFYRLPARPLLKWLYMIFVRRAFLDGGTGIRYATMQAVYEHLIVVRTKEIIREKRADA